MDRLTRRPDAVMDVLWARPAGDLTFNELVACAGVKLEEKTRQIMAGDDPVNAVDAGRDLSLVRTHLEDALTRFNSGCYRIARKWQRADPDAGERGEHPHPGSPVLDKEDL